MPTGSSRSDARILREINGTTVTADELRAFIHACETQKDGNLDFALMLTTATRLAPHDPIRACALAFRARALARIMDGSTEGWVIRDSAGWVFTADKVVAAAASQPLIAGYDDGVFRFNRSRFIAAVLESSPAVLPR